MFASAQRQESILEAIARPAEKSKPWYEYREIFLNDKRLEQGLEFYEEHRATLERAERETGVPATRRDVFLDSDPRPLSIAREFRRLKTLARQRGSARSQSHGGSRPSGGAAPSRSGARRR